MLKAAQVAASLGISRRMVYDLHKDGKLRGYRFGSALRFDPDDVEAYKRLCLSDGTPETSGGGSSSTASLKVAVTGLADFFRGVGVKPKLTPSTARKGRDSTPLRVVSSEAIHS